ncbi:hypothetical protein [Clostridium sp. CF012]|uniref:hypothetical protein n=1 Tax=Clostridium sp. CF012 TaxID=2843319 RepID=UPI001C0B29D7|nr:hypothetical protein [Clostridium sp. CF012]MBU3147009.1 hypothetical protein [Clostridium sp. CF012]
MIKEFRITEYSLLNSLEGKSNKTGIRFFIETNTYKWIGLKIETMLDKNNQYEIDDLKNKIIFCRVRRKFVRGKYKYILQIILEGVVPLILNNDKNSFSV